MCYSLAQKDLVQKMAKNLLFVLLRTLIILIFAVWIIIWFLKPTKFWTKKWRIVEDSMQITILKYNGMKS